MLSEGSMAQITRPHWTRAISGKPTVEQELKFTDVAENKYY